MSKILNFKKVSEICTVTVWEEGISPCDVSLTPKNIYFLQLIICCWLKLDMSLLDIMEFKIGLSQWTGSCATDLRRSNPYHDLARLCAQSKFKKLIFRDFRPLTTFLG